MSGLNFWAILAAAASAFLLGGIWYSPMVFLNIWLREAGKDGGFPKMNHKPRVFAVSFVMSFVAAGAFAIYLGPAPDLARALGAALCISVAWISTCFAINFQFAGRSSTLLLIDAGYHVAQFLLYALVLGLWH